jgi:hypothetical protein
MLFAGICVLPKVRTPTHSTSAPGTPDLAAIPFAGAVQRATGGTTMFETPQEQVPDSKVGIWIGVAIVAVIAIAFFVYVSRKPAKSSPAGAVSMASMGGASSAQGDPTKDLWFVDAKMAKDYTGTTAQWLVDLKNDSTTYTYSNIAYETTYIGANDTVLLVNHGKFNLTLGPGEDQSTQFRDALYPAGTAIYRINITGATSSR